MPTGSDSDAALAPPARFCMNCSRVPVLTVGRSLRVIRCPLTEAGLQGRVAMGLGDWFGGGKKKEQFRDAVKEAVSDGKLTEQKRAELESLRNELGAEAGDDKTQMRRDVYNVAVGAVKAGGKLTPKEEAELRRVQEF